MALTIRSGTFEHDRPIPPRHTEDGQDTSPPLLWEGVPEGAAELALIVDDPDAPTPEPWVHWLIAKIPPSATALGENVTHPSGSTAPAGAVQGTNSFGSIGYGGPAPPKGHGTHHYHFKLYALDAPVDVAEGFDKATLLSKMQGHVLEEAELIGTYQR